MKKLLMGNEAAAWAALISGVRVVAGYPGTPSSEVVETVAKLRAEGVAQGVHVEWSTNEKAALEVAFGASLSGARALFTAKQMGLNVASDALLSLNYVGVRGGLVLYVADDPGPISSQTEQDTRRFAAFAKVPVLDPATPDQLFDMMRYAFDLSEAYGTPVIVRPTTRICHASTFFDVPETTVAREVPESGFEKDDSRWVIFPARSFRAHAEINERLSAIAQQKDGGNVTFLAAKDGGSAVSSAAKDGDSATSSTPCFNPVFEQGENPTLGIVAGGVSAAYVREALTLLEAQSASGGATFQAAQLPAYRFMQVGTPYPFPENAALHFAEGLETILVFEELDYVLEDELLKLAGKHHLPYVVHGKLDGTAPDRGELSVECCCDVLSEQLLGHPYANNLQASPELSESAAAPEAPDAAGLLEASEASESAATPEAPEAPEAPMRPPVLCAGCPHRGSFYAVKQALRKYRGKDRAVLCGDIGCYTLGNAKPLNAVDTCLCMGAGITMAQGIAVAEPGRKTVAFVGDSTFFASGLTGVANAVYNNHDITICVLDNSTTAMTGSQPHPGTGATLMGTHSDPISIEESLRALGVKHIERANAFELGEATAAAKHAIEFEGPAAVIFEGPCIQLTKQQDPPVVDVQTCTGCSGCVKAIGCPAMSMGERAGAPAETPETTNLSPKTQEENAQQVLHIDPALCWGCDLCVQTCPFGAIRKAATHD